MTLSRDSLRQGVREFLECAEGVGVVPQHPVGQPSERGIRPPLRLPGLG